jgi:spore germination protein YaaH
MGSAVQAAQAEQSTAPAPTAQTAPTSTGPRREVFGFARAASLADPAAGFATWNFDDLSTVAFFSLHIQTNGAIANDSGRTVWDSSTLADLVTAAHDHGVKVVVTIVGPSGLAAQCSALYADQTTVSQVVNEVQLKGVDGVNIDYEGSRGTCNTNPVTVATSNQALVTRLAKDMRAGLDAAQAGYYLSIDTYSGSAAGTDGFFNIPALNAYVDSFFVMDYDMDYANQPYAPLQCARFCMAPVSPQTGYHWNDTTSMQQYVSVAGAAKTIMGLPYYGRVACVAKPVAHAVAASNLVAASYISSAAVSSSPDVKPGTFAIHRDASDPAGADRWDTWYDNSLACWREMYWSDTATLTARYKLVNAMGLRGVGFWTLDYGGGSPELWSTLATYFKYCAALSVSASPASPQLSTTQVVLTASAGCPDPDPLYHFSVLAPGATSWQEVQDYSTSSTFAWDTTGLKPGVYRFSVWARDAESDGLSGNASGRWDTYDNSFTFALTSAPCTAVRASTSPASPQPVGTAITVTASASGCQNPLYNFSLLAPGATAYTIVQPYSSASSFTWSATGVKPGTYRFSVWARDQTSWGKYGNSSGRWDAYDNSAVFTLTSCSSVSVSVSPASPQALGTSVTLSATSTGCANPEYHFAVLAPGATAYQMAQDYSTAGTYSWDTTGLTPGTYRFSVWVRDAASAGAQGNTTGTWDAYDNSAVFTLTTCKSASVSVSPASPQASGTKVTLTATSTGCANPEYHFAVLAPGATAYQVVQDYSTSSTFAWDTTGLTPGTYRFSVWVRDAASAGAQGNTTGTWDAYDNNTLYALSG